jgi:hypothetical protein
VRRAAAVLAGIVLGLALSACGSDDEQVPAPGGTASEEVAPERLGCGAYCENAGGYGGGEEGEILMRIETRGRVAPVDDAVPVEVTCLLSEPCNGAILISSSGSSPNYVDVGRSDLVVEGRSTATIAVPMSADGIRALERGGGRLRVAVFADYGDPECPAGGGTPCVAAREVVIDEAAP